MRHLFAIILLLTSQGLYANMASPVRPGTYSSSAFSSRDIDILDEHIRVTPDVNFKTAAFSIEYHIRADSAGVQIPLLFHALDYEGDFRVQLDGQNLDVLPLPDKYLQEGFHLREKFNGITSPGKDDAFRIVYFDDHERNVFESGDLKYFEADLDKGEHRIRVHYTARVWTDRSGWVKTYSFRYSLSPARHWRSFGKLQVEVDTSQFTGAIQTNVGSPVSRDGSTVQWQFSKLPADFLTIGYMPPVNSLAQTLIGIGPLGISIIIALLIVLLHFFLIKKFRKSNPEKKISWVLVLGCIIVPFLVLAAYPFAFDLIDDAIGPDAGRFHGYNILVIGLYPFLFPVYTLVMWFIDRRIKSQQIN